MRTDVMLSIGYGLFLMCVAIFVNVLTGGIAACGSEPTWTIVFLTPAMPSLYLSNLLGLSDGLVIMASFISGALVYALLLFLLMLVCKIISGRKCFDDDHVAD